ncbi:MAG: NAD(P)H-hydrate epimerase [Planctomycetota bacterium]|nr:MAG: NAD(P)H-hydrate epimerase [Planctomycetota bacterium]
MKKFDPTDAGSFVVMSRSEVRRFDAWAINELGIHGTCLMENAGRSCAELIIDKLADIDNPKVCIFCGTGNNGGDGYVIARHLACATISTNVVICGDKSRIKGDALVNLNIIEGLKLPIGQLEMTPGQIADQIAEFVRGSCLLVDALFGTGLKGALAAPYPELINAINICNLPVVAVDIPSGLDCDTGRPLGEAIKAVDTVTFVALKKGFVAGAATANYTGQIHIASIGVEPHLVGQTQ